MPAALESIHTAVAGERLDRIPTPCVLVDLARLDDNLASFQRLIAEAGVGLRPHAKAHKTVEIGDRQLALGAVGLAAAKPSEARVFVEHGVTDIDIAFPVAGWRGAASVAQLARSARVAVHADSLAGLRALSSAATEGGCRLGVLLEIDSGLGRCGIPQDDSARAFDLATAVDQLPNIELDGVVAYAGMASAGAGEDARHEQGGREGRLVVSHADALRARGLEVRRVVAGSTATAQGAASIAGVTEVRAGAYAFMDGAQLGHGTAQPDEVALTVLATVVSHPSARRVTLDAGSKILSAAGPASLGAYATSLDGALRVTQLYEEHGVAEVTGTPPAIGATVRLVPSYASSVVGLADRLVGVHGDRVSDIWPVAGRGCCT